MSYLTLVGILGLVSAVLCLLIVRHNTASVRSEARSSAPEAKGPRFPVKPSKDDQYQYEQTTWVFDGQGWRLK